jgi:hypothetical protein
MCQKVRGLIPSIPFHSPPLSIYSLPLSRLRYATNGNIFRISNAYIYISTTFISWCQGVLEYSFTRTLVPKTVVLSVVTVVANHLMRWLEKRWQYRRIISGENWIKNDFQSWRLYHNSPVGVPPWLGPQMRLSLRNSVTPLTTVGLWVIFL